MVLPLRNALVIVYVETMSKMPSMELSAYLDMIDVIRVQHRSELSPIALLVASLAFLVTLVAVVRTRQVQCGSKINQPQAFTTTSKDIEPEITPEPTPSVTRAHDEVLPCAETHAVSSARLSRRIMAAGFDEHIDDCNPEPFGNPVLTPQSEECPSEDNALHPHGATSVKKLVEEIENKIVKTGDCLGNLTDEDCPVFDMAMDDDEPEIDAESANDDHLNFESPAGEFRSSRSCFAVSLLIYVALCGAITCLSFSDPYHFILVEQPLEEMRSVSATLGTLLESDQVAVAMKLVFEAWADPCNRIAATCVGSAFLLCLGRKLLRRSRARWCTCCFACIAAFIPLMLMLKDPIRSLGYDAPIDLMEHTFADVSSYIATFRQYLANAVDNVARGGAMVAHGQPRVEHVLLQAISSAFMSAIWDVIRGIYFQIGAVCCGLLFIARSLKSSSLKSSTFRAASPLSPLHSCGTDVLGTFSC
jgi:hypothetical protein